MQQLRDQLDAASSRADLAEQQLQRRVQNRQRQQQQDAQWVQAELQQHVQLWQAVLPVLAVCQQQLNMLGPLQLVQLAAGLGKLVHSSRGLLQQAGGAAGVSTACEQQAGTAGRSSHAASNTPTKPDQQEQLAATAGLGGGAAGRLQQELAGVLEGPVLHRLLQAPG